MHRFLVTGVAAALALTVCGRAAAWSWPADGAVLRPFALGADTYAGGQHRGIDVAGADGSQIRAPAAGLVTFAGSLPTYGRGVTILTGDGYSVTLVHLGAVGVSKGETVAEGAPVGAMGSSGTPENAVPSVHLGIRRAADDQGYVDPLGLLPPRAAPSAPRDDPAPSPEPVQPAAPVQPPSPAEPPPPARTVASPLPVSAPQGTVTESPAPSPATSAAPVSSRPPLPGASPDAAATPPIQAPAGATAAVAANPPGAADGRGSGLEGRGAADRFPGVAGLGRTGGGPRRDTAHADTDPAPAQARGQAEGVHGAGRGVGDGTEIRPGCDSGTEVRVVGRRRGAWLDPRHEPTRATGDPCREARDPGRPGADEAVRRRRLCSIRRPRG